jgi:hypothetical protein
VAVQAPTPHHATEIRERRGCERVAQDVETVAEDRIAEVVEPGALARLRDQLLGGELHQEKSDPPSTFTSAPVM